MEAASSFGLNQLDADPPERGRGLRELFQNGNSLARALIAAEILGPPRALREQIFWSQRPNEPST